MTNESKHPIAGPNVDASSKVQQTTDKANPTHTAKDQIKYQSGDDYKTSDAPVPEKVEKIQNLKVTHTEKIVGGKHRIAIVFETDANEHSFIKWFKSVVEVEEPSKPVYPLATPAPAPVASPYTSGDVRAAKTGNAQEIANDGDQKVTGITQKDQNQKPNQEVPGVTSKMGNPQSHGKK